MDERREQLNPLERERWLLGEQSEAERRRCEERLDTAAREQLLRDDESLRRTLFARVPPSELARKVQGRVEGERARQRRASPWLALPAVAALSVLSVVVVTGLRDESSPSSERAKGLELELRVYRQAPDGVEQLVDGGEVRAGDVLQLGYVRGEYAYGVLLSIDGRGTVTLHQPPTAEAPSKLPSEAGQVLLESAYELDDAPQFERFVFVVANEPLPAQRVLEAARALAKDAARARTDALLLPIRNAQRSLLVRKAP